MVLLFFRNVMRRNDFFRQSESSSTSVRSNHWLSIRFCGISDNSIMARPITARREKVPFRSTTVTSSCKFCCNFMIRHLFYSNSFNNSFCIFIPICYNKLISCFEPSSNSKKKGTRTTSNYISTLMVPVSFNISTLFVSSLPIGVKHAILFGSNRQLSPRERERENKVRLILPLV